MKTWVVTAGSGVAALAHTAQPQQVIRPDMLASVDVSDDNWYFNLDVCIHFERGLHVATSRSEFGGAVGGVVSRLATNMH